MSTLDKDKHLYIATKSGVVFQWTNDTGEHQDINYASVTAPSLVYVEVRMSKLMHPFDGVWVGPGSSHSWWTQAGGKILDHNGLDPGETLTITSTGPCALRLDWI